MLRTFSMLLVISGLVFAANPFLGTWKMNVEKSRFNPGPAPKANLITYSMEGDWIVIKAERTGPDGKTSTGGIKYKLDGKEYPYDGPYGKGTMSVTKNGEREATTTIKLDGGQTLTQKVALSPDGKTRTTTTAGTNAQGQKVHNTVVYDRQ